MTLLDEYTALMEVAQEQTVAFLSSINTKLPQLANQPDSFQTEIDEFMKAELAGVGGRLKELSEKIFREMRRELGVI